MRNFCKILLCCFCVIFLFGCNHTEEGGEKYKETFSKMNSEEISLYQLSEDLWGEKSFNSLRKQIRLRKTKPAESEIAFKDCIDTLCCIFGYLEIRYPNAKPYLLKNLNPKWYNAAIKFGKYENLKKEEFVNLKE